MTALVRCGGTCPSWLWVYTCSSKRNEWIAKQHVERNGAKQLTFSPAAEVYSPCRTSISEGTQGPSSVYRLRLNAFLPELAQLLRTVVLFVSLCFPTVTPHVCLLLLLQQKRHFRFHFKITKQYREKLHWRFNLSSELVLLPATAWS